MRDGLQRWLVVQQFKLNCRPVPRTIGLRSRLAPVLLLDLNLGGAAGGCQDQDGDQEECTLEEQHVSKLSGFRPMRNGCPAPMPIPHPLPWS